MLSQCYKLQIKMLNIKLPLCKCKVKKQQKHNVLCGFSLRGQIFFQDQDHYYSKVKGRCTILFFITNYKLVLTEFSVVSSRKENVHNRRVGDNIY